MTPERLAELLQMPYGEYLQTAEWKMRARSARAFAEDRCQLCNSVEAPLHVHHRTYERRVVEMPQDLVVLCARCHGMFHEIEAPKKEVTSPEVPMPGLVATWCTEHLREFAEIHDTSAKVACAWFLSGVLSGLTHVRKLVCKQLLPWTGDTQVYPARVWDIARAAFIETWPGDHPFPRHKTPVKKWDNNAPLAVQCPKCNAGIGDPCTGVEGQNRRTPHDERRASYQTMRKAEVL